MTLIFKIQRQHVLPERPEAGQECLVRRVRAIFFEKGARGKAHDQTDVKALRAPAEILATR